MTIDEAITSCRQDAVTVWTFQDAPDCWQYPDNGGDEDFVAYVPARFCGEPNEEELVPFVSYRYARILPVPLCDYQDYPQPNGAVVRIGNHG